MTIANPTKRRGPVARRGRRGAARGHVGGGHPRIVGPGPLIRRGPADRASRRACVSDLSGYAARGWRRGGSRRGFPSRIPVNGIRISRNTSIETRKPRNRNRMPRNFPSWNRSVEPNRLSESVRVGMNAPIAMRIVAGTRLWMRPGGQRPDRARQRRNEVDHDRHGRDEQVEQELVAGLTRIERVRQHPTLRHEHVRAEDGAEDQHERPGHVQERGQQPERAPEAASPTGIPVASSTAYPGGAIVDRCHEHEA